MSSRSKAISLPSEEKRGELSAKPLGVAMICCDPVPSALPVEIPREALGLSNTSLPSRGAVHDAGCATAQSGSAQATELVPVRPAICAGVPPEAGTVNSPYGGEPPGPTPGS